MKLNGALKPRQGASRQGSSPGVVLKKYRIKRYYKKRQLHQQQTAPLTQQQKQQEKICIEINSSDNRNSSSSSSSLISSSYFSSRIKTKKQNNSTTPNTLIKNRVLKDTKIRNACIDLSSHCGKNRIQSTIKAEAVMVTVAETETAAIEKNNKNNINNEIDLKQRARVNNITTRQFKNTKTNKENKNKTNYSSSNNSNSNSSNKDKKKTKQVKVVKTTLNTSKYHVIVNRSHNNYNNNTISSGGSVSNSYYKQVNKFLLLIPKIYENLNLTFIISRLFIQLKLLLFFMYSHATKHLTGNPFVGFCRGGGYMGVTAIGCHSFKLVGYKLAKIMRASKSLECSLEQNFSKNANKTRIPPSIALYLIVYAVTVILLPQPVVGDDGDNFFPINGIETTTPEFDYASRGQKKFGDKCENTLECGFPGSICDPKKKSCQCTEDLPVTNHIDKCGKEAAVNESCFFNEQCEMKYFQTECRDQKCVCRFDMTPVWLKDGSVECKGRGDKKGPETYIDPAMIGVLIGMALMFIIICVVLRLFSQARWRENRTIFNTPNPRLMNVSLLRESKLLHGQERRGSRMSVRAPSRQPSMASLRPHSPNPSLGKTGSRSNSHGIVVNNSHHERKGSTYQPHQHQHPSQQKLHHQQLQQQEQQPLTQTNIISNPVAETVTVEIIEPEK